MTENPRIEGARLVNGSDGIPLRFLRALNRNGFEVDWEAGDDEPQIVKNEDNFIILSRSDDTWIFECFKVVEDWENNFKPFITITLKADDNLEGLEEVLEGWK